MEACGGAHEVASGVERDAALGLRLLELGDGGEMAIGQGSVAQAPEMFGGVEFGRVGRQEEQVDMLGHLDPGTGVPAGAVEHEHDLFARPRAHLARERGQLSGEELHAHASGQEPDGAPRGRMDQARQVAPRIAMLDRGQGALAWKSPDALENGLQANAVFVERPGLDLGVREGRRDLAEERAEPPLKAACAAASACTWRGRGT